MKELLIATKNKHKVEEITKKLQPLGYQVVSLLDIKQLPPIIEDKDTFEGNALKKAMTLYQVVNKPVLADDSGLIVDALDGAPGVYSARFAGDNSTDKENNDLLLKTMKNIKNRKARFITVMVLVGVSEEPIITKGYLEGSIAKHAKGDHGFGYDPIFIVENDHRHLSEYTMDEKNLVSHRANALKAMIQYFK